MISKMTVPVPSEYSVRRYLSLYFNSFLNTLFILALIK